MAQPAGIGLPRGRAFRRLRSQAPDPGQVRVEFRNTDIQGKTALRQFERRGSGLVVAEVERRAAHERGLAGTGVALDNCLARPQYRLETRPLRFPGLMIHNEVERHVDTGDGEAGCLAGTAVDGSDTDLAGLFAQALQIGFRLFSHGFIG